MSNEIQTVVEAIQQDIISDPEILKNAKLPSKEERLKINNGFVPYTLVYGSWNGDTLKPDLDFIVGFLALRETNFTIKYDRIECNFKMPAGMFHFAFDRKSVIPMCATVFTQVKIKGDPSSILVIGAIVSSKLRYTLMIHPSTWNGIGRTAVIRDGRISL